MATNDQNRKSVRVIAFSSKNAGTLRTVNIKTDKKRVEHPEHLQLTAVQATRNNRTVMDSGGQIAGLPTIYINGYTAPN